MKISETINSNQYVYFSGAYGIKTLDLGNIGEDDDEVNSIEYQNKVTFKELKTVDENAYDYIKQNGAENTDEQEVSIYLADGDFIYAPEFWQ